MRVIFNRLTTVGNKTGVGQYASSLLAALQVEACEHTIDGCPSGAAWLACLAQSRLRSMVSRWRGGARSMKGLKLLAPFAKLAYLAHKSLRRVRCSWLDNHMRFMIEHGGYDVYHEPNFIPVETAVPTIITVHDLSVLLYPEWHPRDRIAHFEKHFLRGLQQSQHVIAVSNSVRAEVLRSLNVPAARVTAIYNGVSQHYQPLPPQHTAAVLKRWGLKPGYLLHLGTLEPRKNLLMLMRAYCALPRLVRDRAPLLLVGSWGWQDRAIREYYQGNARHRGVLHLGYLPERELPALYNGARALVCPSHYEGFGLPCMEMLACGGAVLASTADVFKEILSGQARLIPASDLDGWSTAMSEIIQDEDYCKLLRQGACSHAQKFTWQSAASDTINVYKHVCTGVQTPPELHRRTA